MKLNTAEHTAGNINPSSLRATVFIIAVMSILAFPMTARANRISDDGGREQSELMCNIISAGGQEKEPKQEEKAEPVEITAGITKPELTTPDILPFPLKAALSGQSGTVKLRLIIRRDGSCEVFKVLAEEPENYGFADAARLYLEESRWKPALKDGEPLDVYYDFVVQFPYRGGYAPDAQRIVGDESELAVKIYKVGPNSDVQDPELISRVEPDYPEEAGKMNLNGIVSLAAIVNEKGDLIDIKVLEGSPTRYGFAEKAMEAVSKWKFKPALYKGKPVPIRIRFSVEFTRDLSRGKKTGPWLVHLVEPDYPEEAKKERVSGTVLVEGTVNEKGDLIDIKVLKVQPDRYGFAEKAKEAVSKWKFKPAMYKGKQVVSRVRFTVEFNPEK